MTHADVEREFQRILVGLGPLSLPHVPQKEMDIRDAIVACLKGCLVRSWKIQEEFVDAQNRFDLLLTKDELKMVIEVKRLAALDCVAQLDRYSIFANGLIVICWKATDAFKKVFESAKHSIPIALIQLKQRAPMLP